MKFYFEAEKFLGPYKGENGGSLQSRIFNDKKLTSSPKHIFAVVHSTLKYKEYIEYVIRKSKIKQSIKVSNNLLLLLVHDLLFSPRGRIELGKHPIKDSFLKHKTRLNAEFTKLKLKYKAKNTEDLPTKESDEDETPVRWFRVNTLKMPPEDFLKSPLYLSLKPIERISELKSTGYIYKDQHIPNLFGVHLKEKITASQEYIKGQIIIQDRGSCFPAHILNSDPNYVHSVVIDACAAPGNKTTHVASYLPLKDDSVVYAFERDARRFDVLKSMSLKATGKSKKSLIQAIHSDFTTSRPSDFAAVTGLIVDPSCSGSGIFGRALEDAQQEEAKHELDTERLNRLARFQFKIMKHALLFPSARRVVYSTCSVHLHENERVVVDLLMDPDVKSQGWSLGDRSSVLPLWPRRGWPEEFTAVNDNRGPEELAGGCVRAMPKEDGGIGFFAACFIRDHVDEGLKSREESSESAYNESEEWTGFE
ncbi:uncharacterized protein PRCAT00004189001 [Priceomyces carsonii]|uniref:uncharacterized protein n=1 Tax=Priceomyces carsonii TaxID=28549 RepID=UPI002ED7BDAF|nr:unnamed protein product [Priceomyces carsonii]